MAAAEALSVKNFFESRHILLSIPWIESFIEWCKQEHNLPHNYTANYLQENVYEQWLLQDLRTIEIPALPLNISQKKSYTLSGVFCLQIVKVIDISKPKFLQLQTIQNVLPENGDNTPQNVNFGSRMLQLTLTDGIQEVEAMEFHPIPCLNIHTAPGAKIKLSGPVQVRRGMIMLESKNVKFLGGEVEELKAIHSLENVLRESLNIPGNYRPNDVMNDVKYPKKDSSKAILPQNIINQQRCPRSVERKPPEKPTGASCFIKSNFAEDEFLADHDLLLEEEGKIEEIKKIMSAISKPPDVGRNFDLDEPLLKNNVCATTFSVTKNKSNAGEKTATADLKSATLFDNFYITDSQLEEHDIPELYSNYISKPKNATKTGPALKSENKLATLTQPQVVTGNFDLNDSILDNIKFPDIHKVNLNSNTTFLPASVCERLGPSNINTVSNTKNLSTTELLKSSSRSDHIGLTDSQLEKIDIPEHCLNILKINTETITREYPEANKSSTQTLVLNENIDLDDSILERIEIPDMHEEKLYSNATTFSSAPVCKPPNFSFEKRKSKTYKKTLTADSKSSSTIMDNFTLTDSQLEKVEIPEHCFNTSNPKNKITINPVPFKLENNLAYTTQPLVVAENLPDRREVNLNSNTTFPLESVCRPLRSSGMLYNVEARDPVETMEVFKRNTNILQSNNSILKSDILNKLEQSEALIRFEAEKNFCKPESRMPSSISPTCGMRRVFTETHNVNADMYRNQLENQIIHRNTLNPADLKSTKTLQDMNENDAVHILKHRSTIITAPKVEHIKPPNEISLHGDVLNYNATFLAKPICNMFLDFNKQADVSNFKTKNDTCTNMFQEFDLENVVFSDQDINNIKNSENKCVGSDQTVPIENFEKKNSEPLRPFNIFQNLKMDGSVAKNVTVPDVNTTFKKIDNNYKSIPVEKVLPTIISQPSAEQVHLLPLQSCGISTKTGTRKAISKPTIYRKLAIKNNDTKQQENNTDDPVLDHTPFTKLSRRVLKDKTNACFSFPPGKRSNTMGSTTNFSPDNLDNLNCRSLYFRNPEFPSTSNITDDKVEEFETINSKYKRITTIDEVKKNKTHSGQTQFTIEAKYKQLVEKLTIINNELHLVIMVQDDTGDISLQVDPQLICKIGGCTYSELKDFKKLFLSCDFEILTKVQRTFINLSAIMDIESKENGKTFVLVNIYEHLKRENDCC